MDITRASNALVALGATWILWLLVALSIAALAVIIERCVFLLSTRDDADALRKELDHHLGKSDVDAARKRLEESPSAEAKIVAAGLRAASSAEAEERMTAESQAQRLRMEQHLSYLGTLGSNAPFVGLLGTVIGIIAAFRELDASGGSLSTGLMSEIGEALVATATGLLVALPAVATYNIFQRLIQVRVARGETLGRELLAHLHATAVREKNPAE